jgi:hypothetical protein
MATHCPECGGVVEVELTVGWSAVADASRALIEAQTETGCCMDCDAAALADCAGRRILGTGAMRSLSRRKGEGPVGMFAGFDPYPCFPLRGRCSGGQPTALRIKRSSCP